MAPKYDTTKILIQVRVMSAEVSQEGRREAQKADVHVKSLIQCLQRGATATETLSQALQYARSVRRERGLEKILDAVTFINQNAAAIADTKGKPLPQYEERLRTVCAAGELLNSEKLKKFRATVIKDLYGQQVANDYGDVAKAPESLRTAFADEISESRLKQVIREVVTSKMGGDMTHYNKIFSETEKPPPPEPKQPENRMRYVANPATYQVVNLPVIPREKWTLVLGEVVKAVTK